VVISEGQPLDLDAVIAHLNDRVFGFTCRGSGYVLACIDELSASFVKFRPLGAGSIVSTPQWIENKRAVVNIRNQGDKCFVWFILAHLYPAKTRPDRVSNYTQYQNTLNVTDLTFSLPVKQIAKFESMNPSIAVHSLACDRDSRSFSIQYLSPQVYKREHTITLLLLDYSRDAQSHHYVYVKNLSALISDRDKVYHKCHVCLSCMQVFSSERVLNDYSRCCLIHKPQQTIFPDPNDPKFCKLSFRSHQFEFSYSFYLVADFESFLKPQSSSKAVTVG